MAGSQLRFRDSTGAEQIAARLHLSSSGHLFALTSSGELFGLADEHPRSWQQAALPPLEGVSTEPLILGEKMHVRIADFAPDGSRIASAGQDGVIRFWTMEGEPAKELFDLGWETILSIAFSRDGTRFGAVGAHGEVRQWALGGKTSGDISMNLPASFVGAAFSPDGKRVVLSGDGKTQVFTLDGGFALAGEINEVATDIAFSPDGTRIVSGGEDSTIKLWTVDGHALELLAKAEAGGRTSSIAFSPDGTRIISGGRDGTLRLWTHEMKPAAEPFKGHSESVISVAFSPDGTRIVSGGVDGTARLWTVEGHPLATLTGHTGPVTSVAFSPDGTRILTGGREGTLRLWGLAQLLGAPIIQSVTSFSDGGLWTVGSQGYAAYSRDGRFWESLRQTDKTDLISVAAIGPNAAMALTAKNTLLPLSRTQKQQQQQEKPTALAGGGEQARSVGVPPAFSGRLRALAFVNANSGWVAGDNGLILHTDDGGGNWSKPLFSKDGLTLSDLYIEPSHVGWAVGTYADGQQTVIAANQAEIAGGADSWHELPHHLGPWYFFIGIPALLLSALLLVRVLRAEPPPPQESIEEVATSDQPLRWNEPDARSLKPLARSLSRFLRNINTQPPLTLAISKILDSKV